LHAIHRIEERVIDRIIVQVSIGMGHEVSVVLIGLNRMTGGTVFWRYNNVHPIPVMVKRILVFFRACRVAFCTTNGCLRYTPWRLGDRYPLFYDRLLERFLYGDSSMSALKPVQHDPRRGGIVAPQAPAGDRAYLRNGECIPGPEETEAQTGNRYHQSLFGSSGNPVVTFHIPSCLGESSCKRMREVIFLPPPLRGGD